MIGFRVLRPRFIHQFEEDAKTQAKFHLSMAYFWMVNIPAIAFVFFAMPELWNKYGLFYTLICSLYANFATDFGALSSAQASMKADQIDDVQDTVEDNHDMLGDLTDVVATNEQLF